MQVAPWLDRQEFQVDRFPSAEGAIEIVSRQLIDALLVRYELPDSDLESFLAAVRDRSSPCRRSPLLLLSHPKSLAAANSYIGRGANRAMPLNGDHKTIQATLCSLLNVAPRRACRCIAQLEVKIGQQRDWILCRTRDGSTSGMLLETDQKIPTGTRVDFELTLPAIDEPVVGRGEIARQTLEGREPFPGLGLRFLTFVGDSRRSYEAFLNSRG
ncbi:MAG: PilZ domain-containing protein [Acidobacteriota bacterium]